MFYHNHRRYHSGKRKGKTPMEIRISSPRKKQAENPQWAVLDDLDSPIFYLNMDMLIQHSNQTAKQLFDEYQIAQPLNLADLSLHFGSHSLIEQGEMALIDQKRSEIAVYSRTQRYYHCRLLPKPNQLVLMFIDITDLKAHEILLEQSQQQCQHLLIQQARLASLGEMLGAIAHQWRQPLHVLSLLIGGIKTAYQYKTLTTESLDMAVGKARKQINFMDRTSNNFRHFLTSDQQKVRFNVSTAIEDILDLFAEVYADHYNIHIQTNDFPIAHTLGYANEFRQVILNLLDNAKDAITESQSQFESGRIDINVHIEDQQQIKIHVQDNGGGIKIHDFSNIFDLYYTTKSDKQGSGIGLYMCRVIIEENMMGKLWVENTPIPSLGCVFTIELDKVA